VAASGFCKDNIAKKFRKDSKVIYPPSRVSTGLKIEQRENIVLSVGRISPEKNFEDLALVGPKVPEARFVLLGRASPTNKQIISYIRSGFAKSGLSDHFEYMGWISEERKKLLQDKAEGLLSSCCE